MSDELKNGAEEPKAPEEKGKKGKFVRRTVKGVGVIAILALLFFGGYEGVGLWLEHGTGAGGAPTDPPVVETEEPAESAAPTEGRDENVVIVRIEEDKVTVDGAACADADALKAKIEALYTDGTVFRLEDNHSILATYEWVKAVFDDLAIPLVSDQ